jgi:hypothetical protein
MASYTNTWNSRQDLFRTMPLRSFLVFCLAVGCTFAAIRVVNDLFDLEHSDSKHLLAKVLTTFSFAVLWVCSFIGECPKLYWPFSRPRKFYGCLRLRGCSRRSSMSSLPRTGRPMSQIHGFLLIVLILFSYGWFGTFL